MKIFGRFLGMVVIFALAFTVAACQRTPDEVTLTLVSDLDEAVLTRTPEGAIGRGTNVTITAGEVEGYEFVHWLDEAADTVVTTSAQYTFPVLESITLKAVYAEIEPDPVVDDVTITLSSDPTGATVTVTPQASVAQGTEVTITAEALAGHVFLHWYDETAGAVFTESATHTFTASADMNLVAVYEEEIEEVTISLTSDHPDAVLTVQPAETIAKGTEVTIEAGAITGHVFLHWYDETAGAVFTESATHTFTADSDMDLVAVYEEEVEEVTISLSSDHPDAVLTVQPAGTVTKGTEVTIEAGAITGHVFLHWYDDAAGAIFTDSATHTFTAEADMDLVAVYEEEVEEVTISLASDHPDAVLSILPGGTVATGTEVTIEAGAITDHAFLGWFDKDTGLLVSENLVHTFIAASALELEARYEKYLSLDLTSDLTEAVLTADPATSLLFGMTVTIEASEVAGHYFKHWLDKDSDTVLSENSEFTFTIEEDTVIEAVYGKYLTVTLETDLDGAELTFAPEADIKPGTEVTIEASEVAGHYFKHWLDKATDTVLSEDIVHTFTIEADTVLEAVYGEYLIITLTSEPDGAELSHSPETNIKPGTEVTITAGDLDGHVFRHWALEESGDVFTTEAEHTFTITEDMELVAVYDELKTILLTSPRAGATLTVDPGETVPEGTEVTIEASTVAGYVFLHWYDPVKDEMVSTDHAHTFVVHDDITLEAHYVTEAVHAALIAFDNTMTDIETIMNAIIAAEANTMEMTFHMLYEDYRGHVEEIQFFFTQSSAVLDDDVIYETRISFQAGDMPYPLSIGLIFVETEFYTEIYLDITAILEMLEAEMDADFAELFALESGHVGFSLPAGMIEEGINELLEVVFAMLEDEFGEEFVDMVLGEVSQLLETLAKYTSLDYWHDLDHASFAMVAEGEEEVRTKMIFTGMLIAELFEDLFTDIYPVAEMFAGGELPPYEDFIASDEYQGIIMMLQMLDEASIDFIAWMEMFTSIDEDAYIDPGLKNFGITVTFQEGADLDAPEHFREIEELLKEIFPLPIMIMSQYFAQQVESRELPPGEYSLEDLWGDPYYLYFEFPVLDLATSTVTIDEEGGITFDFQYMANGLDVFTEPITKEFLDTIDFDEPPADRDAFLAMIAPVDPDNIDLIAKLATLIELLINEGGWPEAPEPPWEVAIRFAQNDEWPEQALANYIAGFILEHGYGQAWDTEWYAPWWIDIFDLFAHGEIDVSLFLYESDPGYDEALLDGIFTEAGINHTWKSGLWIPAYMQDAYEIYTIFDLIDHVDLFTDLGLHPVIFGPPSGHSHYNFYQAKWANEEYADLAALYDLYTPWGDWQDFWDTIYYLEMAYENEEPWIGYLPSPHQVHGRFDLVRLEDSLPFDEDTGAGTHPSVPAIIGLHPDLADTHPEIHAFLSAFQLTDEGMNHILHLYHNEGYWHDEVVLLWLRENTDIWTDWVPEDIAAKIHAAIEPEEPPTEDRTDIGDSAITPRYPGSVMLRGYADDNWEDYEYITDASVEDVWNFYHDHYTNNPDWEVTYDPAADDWAWAVVEAKDQEGVEIHIYIKKDVFYAGDNVIYTISVHYPPVYNFPDEDLTGLGDLPFLDRYPGSFLIDGYSGSDRGDRQYVLEGTVGEIYDFYIGHLDPDAGWELSYHDNWGSHAYVSATFGNTDVSIDIWLADYYAGGMVVFYYIQYYHESTGDDPGAEFPDEDLVEGEAPHFADPYPGSILVTFGDFDDEVIRDYVVQATIAEVYDYFMDLFDTVEFDIVEHYIDLSEDEAVIEATYGDWLIYIQIMPCNTYQDATLYYFDTFYEPND